jgi:SAM-dependent methyltransferase
MFHVLEHLDHPDCYLREAHRLLRPGGRLIVQVPNASSWQFALLGAAWNGVDTPRHIHLFRDSDLEKLLVKCGFTPLRKKYFSWRDNPAGLATSLAPSLDPMAWRVRGDSESPGARLAKDLFYFALVLASVPFAAAEAMVRAGSTIMIEAKKTA